MGIRSVTDPARQALAATAARAQAPRPQTAGADRDAATSVPGTAPPAHASPELNAKVRQTPNTIEIVLSERTGTRLHIDKGSNRIVAQIVGRDNNVIKQIPPEEALKIAARMRELHGVMFDETV